MIYRVTTWKSAIIQNHRTEHVMNSRYCNMAKLTASFHLKLFVFYEDHRPRSFDNADDILLLWSFLQRCSSRIKHLIFSWHTKKVILISIPDLTELYVSLCCCQREKCWDTCWEVHHQALLFNLWKLSAFKLPIFNKKFWLIACNTWLCIIWVIKITRSLTS